MPCSVMYSTLSAGRVGFQDSGSIAPLFEENDCRWDFRFNYQSRGPKTWRDRNQFCSRWPSTKIGGGDLEGFVPIGHDFASNFGPYELFSCDGDGTQSKRFIKGTCRDSGGNTVANAIVQGFVTSTDAYVGQDTTREDGTYTLGTETANDVAHYLVAYKPGSPDVAGTTVNTITSSAARN